MPLDLPPPLPPQQAEVAILEERHAVAATQDRVIELEVGEFRLLISGNTYLTEERIRAVTSVAQTTSQAILLLNALYPADGFLLVNVQYARDEKIIYVQVNEGFLKAVDGPPALEPYFEPFEGETRLRKSDLEPALVLAEMQSQRAGLTVSSDYQVDPNNPSAFTLRLQGEDDPDHDTVRMSAAFGNPGNRFLGRYFGLGSAEYYADNGDVYGLGIAHGFTSLGNARGGESYDRVDLSYSTVSTLGLYGLSAAYTHYEVRDLFQVGNDREEADIIEGKATGNQFLYADEDTRWVLEQRLEYVDSTIDIVGGSVTLDAGDTGGGNPIPDLLEDLLGDLLNPGGSGEPTPVSLAGIRAQDEHYGALRLGTTVSHSWGLFDRQGSLSGGLGYKRGFGGDVDNELSDPQRTADFDIYDANLSSAYKLPGDFLLSVKLRTQLTDDRVPQQQQWVLGGPDNLSAFLPGILVGDSGAYGRMQLQLPRWSLLGQPYRFSLFIEHGRAEFEQASGMLAQTTAASDAGIKLEFALPESLEASIHVAQDISTRNLSDERLEANDSDVFFNLKAKF